MCAHISDETTKKRRQTGRTKGTHQRWPSLLVNRDDLAANSVAQSPREAGQQSEAPESRMAHRTGSTDSGCRKLDAPRSCESGNPCPRAREQRAADKPR